MALVYPIIDVILEENKRKAITGDVLFIGKQETFGKELVYSPEVRLKTMDWSEHLGADIVWDLGKPVPEDLWNGFDFIYDGGSLDNMFNPAQGIMNIAKMLRPEGRMICLACASAYSRPYTMFSPGWFHDYFEANKFALWGVYLCSYESEKELLLGPWKWYVCVDDPHRGAPKANGSEWLVVSIAQKGIDSTSDVQPIQYQYRPKSVEP